MDAMAEIDILGADGFVGGVVDEDLAEKEEEILEEEALEVFLMVQSMKLMVLHGS